MSITALALRIAAREVLLGRTWAGPDVFLGAGQIVDDGTDRPRCSIVVDVDGIAEQQATIVLALSMHARTVFVETDENGEQIGQHPGLGLMLAGGAVDLALDAFVHQIVAAFDRRDEGWSDALRGLIRGASPEERMRVRVLRGEDPAAAQRRVCIDVVVQSPPESTRAAKGDWRRFLDEIEAAAGLEAEAVLMRDAIDRRTDEPDWAKLGVPTGIPAAEFAAAEPPVLEAKAEKPKRKKKGKAASAPAPERSNAL